MDVAQAQKHLDELARAEMMDRVARVIGRLIWEAENKERLARTLEPDTVRRLMYEATELREDAQAVTRALQCMQLTEGRP